MADHHRSKHATVNISVLLMRSCTGLVRLWVVVAGRPLFRGEPLAVYVLLSGGISINSYVRLELSHREVTAHKSMPEKAGGSC
jgi:hypothetical protein